MHGETLKFKCGIQHITNMKRFYTKQKI